MSIDPEKAQYCADLVATTVVSQYAKEKGLSLLESLRKVMETKTYTLLQDPESRLCFESAASILDLLNAEERCDWQEWGKV
jgi:hypothetical protein